MERGFIKLLSHRVQKLLLVRYSNTFYMMDIEMTSKTIHTSGLGWHETQQDSSPCNCWQGLQSVPVTPDSISNLFINSCFSMPWEIQPDWNTVTLKTHKNHIFTLDLYTSVVILKFPLGKCSQFWRHTAGLLFNLRAGDPSLKWWI